MKTKIIFVAAILLIAMSFAVHADGDMVTFGNNTDVVIKTLCTKSTGERCTAAQGCDLTAYYPNLTVIASTKNMLFSTDGFFNYTLGVLNQTGDYPSYVNCTDGSINKTTDATFRVTIVSDQFSIGLNNTIAAIKGETSTINNTVSGLNTTLLNESSYGNFTLRQLSTEMNNTKAVLKGLLDKQAEFSAEEVFLITDSLVSIDKLITAMTDNNSMDSIDVVEAGKKLGEIEKAVAPVTAKAAAAKAAAKPAAANSVTGKATGKATPAAADSGSFGSFYIVIIFAAVLMGGFMLFQGMRRPAGQMPIKPEHANKPELANAPRLKQHDPRKPLQYFGTIENRNKPKDAKAHLKELEQLYKHGIIDRATYISTSNRFLEGLRTVKTSRPNEKAVAEIRSIHAKPRLWQMKPNSSMHQPQKKRPKISEAEYKYSDEEIAELKELMKTQTPKFRGWLRLNAQILIRNERLHTKLGKLQQALNNNYSDFGNGRISESEYFEKRGKLMSQLSELNKKMKGISKRGSENGRM